MMREDRISIQGINPEVIKEFKQAVLNKYGKLHTVFGLELQKAMEDYIEKTSMNYSSRDGHTHTHKKEIDVECDEPNRSNKKSTYNHKLEYISKQMEDLGAWDTDTFQKGVAMKLIKENCGGDPRTIQKYEKDLINIWELR